MIPAAPQPVTAPCHAVVHHGVLPSWARAGFSSPRPRMPHVHGGNGDIVAIIFGYPLLSPPARTRGNKILWVARQHSQPLPDLRITAQRMRGRHTVAGHAVRIVRGGPGPSTVNLPAAGCWRLTLRWGARSDRMDLAYRARPRR